MTNAPTYSPLRLEEIAQGTRGTIFEGRLRGLPSVGSTSSVAMEAALQGAEAGLVVFAEEQTAGRGRGGHAWASTRGANLYFSMLLRPPLRADETLLISMMTGLAVRSGVREACALEADLRWPNDLLFGQRKFCGILAEMATLGPRVEAVVVGVGVNVNQTEFDEELRPIACSLAQQAGAATAREAVASAILRALDGELKALLADGPAARRDVHRRFEAHSSFARGAMVTVEELDGELCRTAGLDDEGFLLVERAQGLHRVLHGGVRKAAV